ncbi:MAG: hypothetical protein J6332_03630 [Abditibacteriota bacterium]|nr:hypothetical protein [Abditibacteriota bacterium]
MKRILIIAALIAACSSLWAAVVPCTDSNIYFSPYTWKSTEFDGGSAMEATFPGSYIKFNVTGSAKAELIVCGKAQYGLTDAARPHIEYSIDGGPFTDYRLLTTQDGDYKITMATSLSNSVAHTIIVYFRSAHLGYDRWAGTQSHLFIRGIGLNNGGTLSRPALRPGLLMGFGDSITEGVGVDSYFSTWDDLTPNNARHTWIPFVAAALDCEYGQFGSGGQGMINTAMAVPPLPQTWNKYDADTSRLVDGKLVPQPDYILCAMGTNDTTGGSFRTAYINWIKAVRPAAPDAKIVIVMPPSGYHRDDLTYIFRNCGDDNTILIDTEELNGMITVNTAATGMTYDGVHPNEYGQAMYGISVASKINAASQMRDISWITPYRYAPAGGAAEAVWEDVSPGGYECCLGLTSGSNALCDWTYVDEPYCALMPKSRMSAGRNVYLTVRPVSRTGYKGPSVTAMITYANPMATLDDVMTASNGKTFYLEELLNVTGVFSDCVFVENDSRTRGIKVIGSFTDLTVGDTVKVTGKTASSDGTRAVTGGSCIKAE